MNGLTDRVNHIEGKLNRLADSDDRREKLSNRFMLILIGVAIALSTGGIMWTVKHFAQHSVTQQIQKP